MHPKLSLLKAENWAITPAYMDVLTSVAVGDAQGLAARQAEPLDGTQTAEVRDGVAIIPVHGPLMNRSNFVSRIFGDATYDVLAQDIAAAAADPDIEAIVLDIDSPGGMVSGLAELADMVRTAASQKPVTAYVSGMAASAAYWIASAANEVIAGETAQLGSIGVVMTITDFSGAREDAGIKDYEIVSTQSPHKRLDPADDSDMARLQARVDSLASVFVAKVAEYRGVSVDAVQENFGQGDILVGQSAVSAGLADRLGSFEGTLAELTRSHDAGTSRLFAAAGGGTKGSEGMSLYLTSKAPTAGDEQRKMQATAENLAQLCPEAAEELRKQGADAKAAELQPQIDAAQAETGTEAAEAERARIATILGSEEAKGREDLARHLALEDDMPADKAVALLGKSPKADAAPANPLAAAMGGEPNPDVGADGEGAADELTAFAERNNALGKEYGIE